MSSKARNLVEEISTAGSSSPFPAGRRDPSHDAYTLAADAGVMSSSHAEYQLSKNEPGWNKVLAQLKAETGRANMTIDDVGRYMLELSGADGFPGLETLWLMVKDPEVKAQLWELCDFNRTESDTVVFSYLYGGPHRVAAFKQYGSTDPAVMAASIHALFTDMQGASAELEGSTVTVEDRDSWDWDWSPEFIANNLKEHGWDVTFEKIGNTNKLAVNGFNAAGADGAPAGRSKAESLINSLLGEAQPGELPDDGEGDGGGDTLTDDAVEQILRDCITSDCADEFPRVATFEDEGIMTRNKGLVLYGKDGTTWQLTIVQGRSR